MLTTIPSQAGADRRSVSISADDFDYIRMLIQRRSAIVLDAEKMYLAEARLNALARREGFASLGDLLVVLRGERDETLTRKVVEAMTTNETSFFRDLVPFESIRTVLLPEAIRQRQGERVLRIWSAACSTGQEPYSIAMILAEHFPQLRDWNIQILATDLSTEILERAQCGRFSQLEVNRGLPARLLVKYFGKQGNDWFLQDEIRKMVEFREINLAGDWPLMHEFDIVLLRNVLIYFDMASKRRILQRVRRLLKPWGSLILGGAETTLNIDDAYERVQLEKTIVYRRGKS